jgi:hypothetical protein
MANPRMGIVLFIYAVLIMDGNVGGSSDVMFMSYLCHGALSCYPLPYIYYSISPLNSAANVSQLVLSYTRRCMNSN